MYGISDQRDRILVVSSPTPRNTPSSGEAFLPWESSRARAQTHCGCGIAEVQQLRKAGGGAPHPGLAWIPYWYRLGYGTRYRLTRAPRSTRE